MNVHFDGFKPDGLAFIDDAQAQALANVVVEANDVLLNITGASIGRVCLAPDDMSGARVNQHVCIIRLNEVEQPFIQAFLAAPDMQRFVIEENYGLTRQALTKGMIEDIIVPLPPLAEQRRIVAKLNALTVRLARARAELDRVPVLAEKIRRTVLSRAFSGELTVGFRGEAESHKETCRAQWSMRELGQISEIQGGIQVGKQRSAGQFLIETPYLRVANVQRGWLKLDEIKTLAVTPDERQRLALRQGDILMNEGGDRDKLGRGWVWQGQVQDCIHQNHVFRIRLLDRDFPPEFVSHYANEFGQQYFIDQGTQTTNLASISKRKVAALPIPVPPVSEAKEIVRLIEAAFTRADRLEAEAERAQALLDRLEAALFAKAFRGELIQQDPNDEPAQTLLDRIRSERAVAPKAKRGRKAKVAA
jgi:type I restriction enzyme S subunit